MSDGCLFLHAPSKARWLLCVSVVCLVAFFFLMADALGNICDLELYTRASKRAQSCKAVYAF